MLPETRHALTAVLIAVIGFAGLALAADGETWRSTYGGLLLFAAAVVLEFRLIDQHFDIKQGKRRRLQLLPPVGALVPERLVDQWASGLLIAALGLGGLYIAGRAPTGAAEHDLGLLVFVLAVLYEFALLKVAYDRRYSAT